jgi:hypothetical protein
VRRHSPTRPAGTLPKSDDILIECTYKVIIVGFGEGWGGVYFFIGFAISSFTAWYKFSAFNSLSA